MKKVVLILTALLVITQVYGQPITIKVGNTTPAPPKRKVTGPPIGTDISVCYKYVGCFNNRAPFNNTGGELPNPPELVGTHMLLYTYSNKLTGHWIDYRDKGKTLDTSNFNTDHPVKFVIHGFSQDEREKWLHQMKDALFTLGPVNVVIVGWGPGASLPDYPQAVANTRLVAKQIEMVVNNMQARGMELSRIHLIGHSLGAHISGYVGHAFNGKIGRISGMDPAGPLYESTGEEVRLHKGDAIFVDVTHSNGAEVLQGGAGMYAPCGDVDFYPNGGLFQPGCPGLISGSIAKLLSGKPGDIGDLASCSHSRSHRLYTESIKSRGCMFLGHKCADWDTYQSGGCRSCGEGGCSELGYHSIEYGARGIFYTITKGFETGAAPEGEEFCGVTYDITISPKKNNKATIKGAIDLKITGSVDHSTAKFQGKSTTLEGKTKAVIVDYAKLGDLQAIEVLYTRNEGVFFGWGSGDEEWKLNYVTVAHDGKVSKFCETSAVLVRTGQPTKLKRCN